MIEFLKTIARKSERVRGLYRALRFSAKIVRNDLRNPRKAFLFFRVLPYTMVSYEALSATYALAQKAEQKGLGGAFVECGVWKGGAAGVMAHVARQAGSLRDVWLFDSFERLPEPVAKDGARAKEYARGKNSGTLSSIGKCVGPLEDVQKLFFSKLKLPGENIHIEQGWFQDTLPNSKEKISSIAVLRLDGDWYESTKVALEHLFESVVSGGYVILDDYYCWEDCQKAVDEFFIQRGTRPSVVRVDRESAYIQLP